MRGLFVAAAFNVAGTLHVARVTQTYEPLLWSVLTSWATLRGMNRMEAWANEQCDPPERKT